STSGTGSCRAPTRTSSRASPSSCRSERWRRGPDGERRRRKSPEPDSLDQPPPATRQPREPGSRVPNASRNRNTRTWFARQHPSGLARAERIRFETGARIGFGSRSLYATVLRMSDTAVILMAYGSPERVADVPAYYSDIRGGRPIAPEHLEDLVSRYRSLGIEDSNPHNAITEATRAALQEELGVPVYTGLKPWPPRIPEAVDAALAGGAEQLVGRE